MAVAHPVAHGNLADLLPDDQSTSTTLHNLASTAIGDSPSFSNHWTSGTATLVDTYECLPGSEALVGQRVAYK
jgi:hypothetical protein